MAFCPGPRLSLGSGDHRRGRRAMFAPLALAVAGLPLTIAATIGVTRAAAAPAPAWTAYVANVGSNNVTPIDTATNTAGAAIKVGGGPVGTAITPDGKTAYVANSNTNNVTPIDTATNTAGTAIAVGTFPVAVAITPDGKTAYVANSSSDNVIPIDTATNIAGTPIGVGTFPEAIAITPDGKTAYVANAGSNNVIPINTASNTAGTPIGVGTAPNGAAITPDGKTAYVTNAGSDNVTPINTATNTVGTDIAVGGAPTGIAITPDQAPAAHLSVTPAHAGSPSYFDASASTVRFGAIASYAWNFGDGTSTTTTTPTITHTYALPGGYTASVTETSAGGTSTTKVFTGQTMSRNGGPSALAAQQVTVPATIPPGAGVMTSPQFGVPGQTDLFDVNNNGAVEVRWIEGGGTWNGPLVISPANLAPPGTHLAASAQFGVPNQTDVFVVGNDGAAKVLWVDEAGAWRGPLSITPAGSAQPGAAVVASNQFGIGNQTDVFVVGGDGATRVSWVSGAGAWKGPIAITPANTAPAGAHLATSPQFGVPNQTDLFVVGNDGATRVSWVSGAGTWQGPLFITPTGTAPAGAALAASQQFGVSNQTDVFLVDKIGATRVSWVSGAGAWSGPMAITPAGNAPNGAHLAASNQFGVPNQTDIFVVNNGGFAQVSWVQGAGAWKGPTQL